MADCSQFLIEAVAKASAEKAPLYITAGGTKHDIRGRACTAQMLDISGHTGIIDYQPSELVLTARAGTTLADIEAALDKEGQILAFEPPRLGEAATIGGTLACNLSGPARPWRGSVRDMVLGVQLINGRAELLNFGGRVMKNVAGYDISRVQAGAMGTLGVLSQISLKVLPKPEASITLAFELSIDKALAVMIQRTSEPKPLSGAMWNAGRLYLRLSGAAKAVEHTATVWGGEKIPSKVAPWLDLRELRLPFFEGHAPLWRFSQNAAAPLHNDLGEMLLDWGGAQRWLRGDLGMAALQQAAALAGGHVCQFRGGDRSAEVSPSLSTVEQRLHRRLKQSFDPEGILNPGRLYSWL
jgi:glycolate oxidase FAD binding subunit